MAPEKSGAGATLAVLWLMILIVFLPIALAHGVALYIEAGDIAAVHASTGGKPGS